ncbi:hypothetical protein ACQKMW_28415 [Pseudomonas sivasensis]
MNKHAIIRVLAYLGHYDLISREEVHDKILDNAKSGRKGLTKEEITDKGLNIYPKSGIKIDVLIEELIEEEYIEVQHKDETKIRISSKGIKYLMELYTDNYCDSFLSFKDKIDDLTQSRNETDFNPIHVAGMFYQKRNLNQIEDLYFTEKSIQEVTEAYHNYMLDKYGLIPNNNDFLFHLSPKLFLPAEDMWEEVELIIKGIDLPEQPIFLDRPYPNKRYIVAGTKIGKEKFTTGFYPIIASEDEFPKEKSICYHWKLGNGKEIIHDIDILFEVDRGNLFSTEQTLSRSNDLSTIRVYTSVEESDLINKNRTINYMDINKNILHMKETVVLTSFPTKLHSTFFADKYYKRWKKQHYQNK